MKTMLKISNNVSLPTNAVTQTFAQIGRKGAGKTYLASMIAEHFLDVKAQVIVIDPIGNWWGLRVDKDGKSKGKDIFVIGGLHGDVPLSSESGKQIAKLLTEKNISVVLDVSEFRKNERKKFVTDFAEEFYHLKKNKPLPCHIFLEESQKFVPQRVMKDESRMLGAWEDIVRLGRNYGIGCSLISQRPQSINKEVLSQVECLCVLQVTGLHERKALEEWVKEAGEDRKIIGELPSLNRGEGYIWSPAWLKIFKKVKFNIKTTFDTSATPKLGKAIKAAKISKIDIEKLKQFFSNVVEKTSTEKEDKKILTQKNNELIRKIRVLEKNQNNNLNIEQLKKAKNEGYEKCKLDLKLNIQKIKKQNTFLISTINKLKNLLNIDENLIKNIDVNTNISTQDNNFSAPSNIENNKTEQDNNSLQEESELKLPEGMLKILRIISKFYPEGVSKNRISLLTGFSFKSGTFGHYIYTLKKNKLIKNIENNLHVATEKGLEYAGNVEPVPTDSESIINLWKNSLKGGSAKIFEYIVSIYPESCSKEELGNENGMSYSSGTFGHYLYILRKNKLININGGQIKASSELF